MLASPFPIFCVQQSQKSMNPTNMFHGHAGPPQSPMYDIVCKSAPYSFNL